MEELSPQRWNDLQRFQPSFVTLGNFDGVHLGHAQVLNRLKDESDRLGLDPLVVTFEPHPRHFFRPDDPCHLLASPKEKAELLSAFGIEIITLQFDKSLATLPAETFVQEFLVKRLLGRRFLLGHDHRFGAEARGNADLIRSLMPSPVEGVEEISPILIEGELVSSSVIRSHLEHGDLTAANRLLGRPFEYEGTVVQGAGRARTLQVPTANLETGCKEKVRVAPGVYFGLAHLASGEVFRAIANLGFAPTFGPGGHKIEIHIPGFSGDLYGQGLRFQLFSYHRKEIRFSDIHTLQSQIFEDLAAFQHFSLPL